MVFFATDLKKNFLESLEGPDTDEGQEQKSWFCTNEIFVVPRAKRHDARDRCQGEKESIRCHVTEKPKGATARENNQELWLAQNFSYTFEQRYLYLCIAFLSIRV